ncbi:MAG: fumarate hydratase subunit alpha [Candidatus Promineifilaceae bacterium]
MIREISVSTIQKALCDLIQQSAHTLPADYLDAMREAEQREASQTGRIILNTLMQNAAYAKQEQIPTCQDTGMAIVMLEIGQEVHFVEGDLGQALNLGVKQGYADLRKSVVIDPLIRDNTADNTPAIVHTEIVPGDKVKLTLAMKGFGAELMSRMQMFPPSVGRDGVKKFVLETVELAGPNACPPVIVGVGLGSSFDGVGLLAKKALMRPLGQPSVKPHLAELEQELLNEINALGIGPQGFGGTVTALAVHVESFATHIAALPVAVNLNCSAPRRAMIEI